MPKPSRVFAAADGKFATTDAQTTAGPVCSGTMKLAAVTPTERQPTILSFNF
jgi:hypothetical protein